METVEKIQYVIKAMVRDWYGGWHSVQTVCAAGWTAQALGIASRALAKEYRTVCVQSVSPVGTK